MVTVHRRDGLILDMGELPLKCPRFADSPLSEWRRSGPDKHSMRRPWCHEAYLRLVEVPEVGQWDGRGHFFAAAAEAMRRILVENARRKSSLKHGGQRQRVPVSDVAEENDDSPLLALDDALTRLAAEDRVAAKIVEMHHFAGLSHEVVADSLGLTVYRVRQKWTYAQVWLRDAIER
jgi:RNA polymerase sigma factor (TIGR02999 family)